jgi:hypothetical protein
MNLYQAIFIPWENECGFLIYVINSLKIRTPFTLCLTYMKSISKLNEINGCKFMKYLVHLVTSQIGIIMKLDRG